MPKENKTIKIKLEIAKEIMSSLIGHTIDEFILIQQLSIEDEGKYQHENYVVLHTPTRKFYMGGCTRSGSYFSDYNYDYDEDKDGMIDFHQVRIVPVETFKWVGVK